MHARLHPNNHDHLNMNVLFLCTGNSCRSILGETTFSYLAPAGWKAMSAGSQPAGYVHPRSLALLAREGIATDGYFSKSWDNLPATPDIVIKTLARGASNTFAGIRPVDAPGFIVAQLLGAVAATLIFCWLYPAPPRGATVAGTVAPSQFTTSERAHD